MKLTKLNCPRSCCHRKELLAQLGLCARKYSSCGTFSSRHASSFRGARIKIITCYGKSIRATINHCLSNALQVALSIHTIGLTENSLQGKILRSQVRSPTMIPFGSERSRRTSVPRVSLCVRSLVVVLFPLGMRWVYQKRPTIYGDL